MTYQSNIKQKSLFFGGGTLFTFIIYLINASNMTETGEMLINTVKLCTDSLTLQN